MRNAAAADALKALRNEAPSCSEGKGGRAGGIVLQRVWGNCVGEVWGTGRVEVR